MGQSARHVRTENGQSAVEYFDTDWNKTETRIGGGRMWRNNNPGNLRGGKDAIGTDRNGFAIFPDLETGRQAQADLLRNDSRYKGKTIEEMIPIYAPAADGNDVKGYAKDIGDFSGLDLKKKIEDLSPEEYDRLMEAIRRREGAIDKEGNPLGVGKAVPDLSTIRPVPRPEAEQPQKPESKDLPAEKGDQGDVGGLANEAAETQKAMERVNNEEQTVNLDSRIQSMRDLAAQPVDHPAQSALLKPVDTWTKSEMQNVLNSAQGDFSGAKAGDPLKAHLYEKVQDWHTTNYGEGEQQYEGGKPVEPQPIRTIPKEAAPHLAKDGGDLWQASARMGDKLTGIAQTDGYEPSVKALQNGLNMLNDANPPAERSPVWGDYTPQDRLKVDGDYGPKTDFALKSALANQGEDKVDGAMNLGRFKGFAEEAKGGDASGLGTMTTSLFGDDSGEALQRTLNRVGPNAVEDWQPIKEDNQIGPMTTNAFASVMDSFDPGEFTRGFGEEMGLL